MAAANPTMRMIEITPGHSLNRTTVFSTPLHCAQFRFSSIEQMYYACCFAQHNMFLEADAFWKTRPQHDSNPAQIADDVRGFFQSRRVQFDACWIFYSKRVMRTVLREVMQHEDQEFTRYLRELHARYGTNLHFVLTTNSKTERVWSCGFRKGSVPSDPIGFSGANLYGECVQEAYTAFFNHNREERVGQQLETVLTRCILSPNRSRKTAVIISDSIFKHAMAIEGGDIWYQRGATFGDLARAIKAKYGNVMEFKYIIVSAGTNDAMRYPLTCDREESWKKMRSVLDLVADHPDIRVFVHTGIGVPRWPKVPAYTEWFSHAFERDYGSRTNMVLIDWSFPSKSNYFMPKAGSVEFDYLDSDERHPNVSGTRCMWKACCDVDPDGFLRLTKFTTSQVPYMVSELNEIDFL